MSIRSDIDRLSCLIPSMRPQRDPLSGISELVPDDAGLLVQKIRSDLYVRDAKIAALVAAAREAAETFRISGYDGDAKRLLSALADKEEK